MNAMLVLVWIMTAAAAAAVLASPKASGELARWLRAHAISLYESRELRMRRKVEEMAVSIGTYARPDGMVSGGEVVTMTADRTREAYRGAPNGPHATALAPEPPPIPLSAGR